MWANTAEMSLSYKTVGFVSGMQALVALHDEVSAQIGVNRRPPLLLKLKVTLEPDSGHRKSALDPKFEVP